MAKLIDNKQKIIECNPDEQEIEITELHSLVWMQLIREKKYPLVGCIIDRLNFSEEKKCRVITRNDIVSSRDNPHECIIKALIWAFPNDIQKNRIERVLKNLPAIVGITGNYIEKNLSEEKFLNLYGQLYQISGVKDRIISVIFYALGISCNGKKAVAITQHVINAFEFYEEIKPFRIVNYRNREQDMGYLPRLFALNIEALKIGVDVEQLEYFLFKEGKNNQTIY